MGDAHANGDYADREHPGCNYLAVLIDGADAENAGIVGGDLLFCNKCGWCGRPSKNGSSAS